jgi:hypothetical protein
MISKPSGKNRTSDKHTRDGNKGRLRAFGTGTNEANLDQT